MTRQFVLDVCAIHLKHHTLSKSCIYVVVYIFIYCPALTLADDSQKQLAYQCRNEVVCISSSYVTPNTAKADAALPYFDVG